MIKRNIAFTTSIVLAATAFSAEAQDGLTWTKIGVDDLVGAVHVGCGTTPGVGAQCNPYNGDTLCTAQLPVLCFNDANLQQPALLPPPSIYHRWSGGIVATTDRVRGDSFQTIRDANQFCVNNFGTGWRVAEFHDGWGWNFQAYGNVGNDHNASIRRFWVDINDQPQGTCWSR